MPSALYKSISAEVLCVKRKHDGAVECIAVASGDQLNVAILI